MGGKIFHFFAIGIHGYVDGIPQGDGGTFVKNVVVPLKAKHGCFPKIGVPQNGWFIMEHPISIDDLGIPLFLETPTWNLKMMMSNFGISGGAEPAVSSFFLDE